MSKKKFKKLKEKVKKFADKTVDKVEQVAVATGAVVAATTVQAGTFVEQASERAFITKLALEHGVAVDGDGRIHAGYPKRGAPLEIEAVDPAWIKSTMSGKEEAVGTLKSALKTMSAYRGSLNIENFKQAYIGMNIAGKAVLKHIANLQKDKAVFMKAIADSVSFIDMNELYDGVKVGDIYSKHIALDLPSSFTITDLADTGDLVFSGSSPRAFDSKESKSFERLYETTDTTSSTSTTTVSSTTSFAITVSSVSSSESLARDGSTTDSAVASAPTITGVKFDQFKNLKAIYTGLATMHQESGGDEDHDTPVAEVLDKIASGEIIDALSPSGQSLRHMVETNDVEGIISLAKQGETFSEHVKVEVRGSELAAEYSPDSSGHTLTHDTLLGQEVDHSSEG